MSINKTQGTSLDGLFSINRREAVDAIDTFSVDELRERLKHARDVIMKTNKEIVRLKEANLRLQGLS